MIFFVRTAFGLILQSTTLSFSKKPNKDNLLSQYAIKKIGSFFNQQGYYPADASIEHIIPESNTPDITHSMGNLIMLEKKINDECKDLPYANKVALYENSNYAQVDKFLSQYPNFKKTDISKRTNFLAELYYNSILLPMFS
ncbi:HNH endonuclease family protein [Liquorilactobacillus hordei]|uniref:HNH endonuclease family protein n=1 Tax=Liquorilactobacillus hordei TaxID=468911 RepID=UPI0039EB7023